MVKVFINKDLDISEIKLANGVELVSPLYRLGY